MATRRKASISKTQTKTTAQQTLPEPSEQAIAKRAYELYIARGKEHGRDQDDWLCAERELLAAEP